MNADRPRLAHEAYVEHLAVCGPSTRGRFCAACDALLAAADAESWRRSVDRQPATATP